MQVCSSKHKENIIVLKNGHWCQVDVAALIPYEMSVMFKRWPKLWLPDLYQLNSYLWINFLDKLDRKQSKKPSFHDMSIAG
jgi:hypothetical protein